MQQSLLVLTELGGVNYFLSGLTRTRPRPGSLTHSRVVRCPGARPVRISATGVASTLPLLPNEQAGQTPYPVRDRPTGLLLLLRAKND